MAIKDDPQSGMWDRTIEDPELADALESWLENKEAAAAANNAKSRINKRLETLDLKDGERVRINGYVIVGKSRSGGDFEIPPWSKVGIGQVVETA